MEDNKSDLDLQNHLLQKRAKANWVTEREYNYSVKGETTVDEERTYHILCVTSS